MSDLIERVARDIADALGDNFDYAFAGKSEWITHRGETPAGFRDVNQPYKTDYIDAAIAAIAIIKADRAAVEAEVEAATIAKVVAWLRSLQNNGSANQAFAVAIRHACADAIEAGEYRNG